jgi:transcriptional regulator with XRE-family HTH domain
VNLVQNNSGRGDVTVLDRFGSRARALRVSQQRSQGAVAARMRQLGHDWHQTTVSKVETRQRPVSLREAYDLARALDRDLRDFLVWESSEHEQAALAVQIAFERRDAIRLALDAVKGAVQAVFEAADAEYEGAIASAPKPGRKRKA